MPQKSAGAPSIRDNQAAQRRPRTEDRGFLGEEGDERDPVAPRGLLESAHDFLQQPQTPQDITPPTETSRPGRRPPNDDDRPALRPAPVEEEAPPLLPGDPSNLGARGRRRRSQDELDASPVLRRGLLGV